MVTDLATFVIPVEIFCDTGMVLTRPKSFFLGYLPQCSFSLVL